MTFCGVLCSLWATDHYQPLRMFAGHLADITCTRFHPNSNYVATGSSDRTIRLWDVLTGNCVRILTGHKVRHRTRGLLAHVLQRPV
jgi:WD40 repeat protein